MPSRTLHGNQLGIFHLYIQHLIQVLGTNGHGFLQQDMFSSPEALNKHLFMQVRRSGNKDRIHFGIIKHIPVIMGFVLDSKLSSDLFKVPWSDWTPAWA